MPEVSAQLVGNLTDTPELRYTTGGTATARCTVAVNRKHKDREETDFVTVIVWGEFAENVAHSLRKGARVVVAGRFRQRSWDDRDTGKRRTTLELHADALGPDLRFQTVDQPVGGRPRPDQQPVPGQGGGQPHSGPEQSYDGDRWADEPTF